MLIAALGATVPAPYRHRISQPTGHRGEAPAPRSDERRPPSAKRQRNRRKRGWR